MKILIDLNKVAVAVNLAQQVKIKCNPVGTVVSAYRTNLRVLKKVHIERKVAKSI